MSRYDRTFCVYIHVFIRDAELPCHIRDVADLANNMGVFFAAAANPMSSWLSFHDYLMRKPFNGREVRLLLHPCI